jgi:predicted transcriptional regulator
VLSQEERPAGHKRIEDVLCSKTRLKILKILIGSQLTPSQVAKEVGVCYSNAVSHLEALKKEGILCCVRFGERIRFYNYNETSPIATAVRNLIEVYKT